MDVLEILLIVYSVLLLINTVFSIQLWLAYRHRLYLLLIGVWVFTLVNFVLQSLSLNSVLGSVLGFSTYILTAYCLCTMLAKISEIPFSFNKYWTFYAVGTSLSVVLQRMDYPFALMALPAAIAVAAPQITLALKKLLGYRHQGIVLSNTFALILLLNGCHFLDYPFLRPNLDFAVFGYAIVIAFSMIFAALLPCIMSKYHSDQLIDEIDSRKKTEQKLADALRSAEKLTQKKTYFLANMSHEIRTPLHGVIGLNDLMKHTPLNEKQRSYCESIETSSNHLLNILNNILSLVKLESGVTPIHRESFAPATLAQEIISHYEQSQKDGPLVSYQMAEPMPERLISDKGKLRQVAFNLINNAIKYSGSGTIQLLMRYEAAHDEQGNFFLTVKDQGVGIPPDTLSHVFHPFEQNNRTTQGSVGLGLSITKELLTVLGGTIHVSSELNHGTIATCKLPILLDKTPLPEGQANAPIEPMLNFKTADVRPNILVVEDHHVNQLVMEEMLNKEKVNYVIAKNGKEAMANYRQRKPDLIFMDIQLPDTDGLELIKLIRVKDKQTPIIVLSAFAFDEDSREGLGAGANDYVRKPAKHGEIKRILDKYLFHSLGYEQ